MDYNFTGGNWKGEVDESTLTVHLDCPGTYLVSPYSGDFKPVFRRDGRDFIYTWRHWQAETDFSFDYCTTLRDFLLQKDDSGTNLMPVKIDVPARTPNESYVDLAPSTVVRRGRLLIALQTWVNSPAAAGVRNVGDPNIASKIILKRTSGRAAYFTPRDPDTEVVTGLGPQTVWYIPASRLTQLFGARFSADLPHHLIQFLPPN